MDRQPDQSPPPQRPPHPLEYAGPPPSPTDPSIENEPHLTNRPFRADQAEDLAATPPPPRDEEQMLEHSVWDEPSLARQIAGAVPAGQQTYGIWLQTRQAAMTRWRSWGLTLLIALAAGPWAVVGALWGTGQSMWGVLVIVVFAPVTEELMKIAIPLWVVEMRPWVFISRLQILLCALAAGVAFAAIENLLYLYVYIPDPPAGLATWRWTVNVAVHSGCSLIAGVGVMRIWANTVRWRRRPEVSLGFPFLVAAAVVHGTYNAFAVLLELGWGMWE